MKVISNEKLIKRYGNIGKYINILAIVVLFGGMIITFSRGDFFWIALIALFAGFILSQVSFFFINRWGRHPRIDELVTSSLKGLTNDYTLYHYNTPVSHLLIGPAGVWTILPYYQRGTISYEKNRWKQRGGGIALAYLKIFAQEGLGRPDLDSKSDINSLTNYFQKSLPTEMPPIHSVIIFTDKRAVVQADNAPISTMPSEGLKEFIRRYAKDQPFPADSFRKIKEVLPQEEKAKKKQE
jgi:hypothetical protein